MVKLVIFDAEGILHDSLPASKHFSREVERLLKGHSMPGNPGLWADLGMLAGSGKITMREAHRIYLSRRGVPENALGEYERIDMESFKKMRLIENGIRKTLLRLRSRGYKIAVLSDTGHSSRVKRKILKYLGIDVFDAVFVSSEIGRMKPDKEAYEAVMHHFHVHARDTIFVGHEAGELDGARSIGITTISYRGHPADYNIKSFSEIADIVENL